MKISASTIRLLLSLVHGETVADSRLKGEIFRHLKGERHLVAVTHGSRKSWRASNSDALRFHLADTFGLSDLEQSLQIAESESTSRAELVEATGDSKFKNTRTFKGFLVNCYQAIDARLNGQTFIILPCDGTFTFIYDFENFCIPTEVIVVGIENAENFRWVAKQKKFFAENISSEAPLLFVCRYPQSQHGDLIKWLKIIPNRYVHFGDLDPAGIKIFLTEYLPHLGSRASFLVPKDFDERVASGSHERYNDQLRYMDIIRTDTRNHRLLQLVESIERHHSGYDQEGFILS